MIRDEKDSDKDDKERIEENEIFDIYLVNVNIIWKNENQATCCLTYYNKQERG